MYDVIIIGKGPAGLSAALYTVRANLSTFVIGKNDSAIAKSEKIDNYFGFEHTLKGQDLLLAGEKQAKRLGTEMLEAEIIAIDQMGKGFTVKTATDTYEAKALLLATGTERKTVAIEGVVAYEGKGVSYCTTCDGFFYRDLPVAVVGNGDFALLEAHEMEAFTKKIRYPEVPIFEKF